MRGSTRRRLLLATMAAAALAGCSGGYAIDDRGVVLYPDPVGVPDLAPPPGGRPPAARAHDIPPGHYPPPGRCRVWFPDRPPGRQPPPGSCSVRVPRGAVLVRG